MKKRIIALILLCAVAVSILSACTKPKDDTSKLTEGRTLFIYMCGSNLETKQGLAGKNIDEILSANIGNDVDVVIETGGALTILIATPFSAMK